MVVTLTQVSTIFDGELLPDLFRSDGSQSPPKGATGRLTSDLDTSLGIPDHRCTRIAVSPMSQRFLPHLDARKCDPELVPAAYQTL